MVHYIDDIVLTKPNKLEVETTVDLLVKHLCQREEMNLMKFQRLTSVKFLGDPVMQDMSDIPFNVKDKCCIWSPLEQRRTHNASWTFLGFWRQHIPLWRVLLGSIYHGTQKAASFEIQ